MRKTSFWLQADNHTTLFVRKWVTTNKTPKAIVHIVHGMAEHADRYDTFARYLVKRNIFVYGSDLRGHGKTAEKQGRFGYLADGNGFNTVTEDIQKVTVKIKEEFPGVPVILFGHSFGSFLARNYIQAYGNSINGLILSGTGGHPGKLRLRAAMALAKNEIKRKGGTHPSFLLQRLVFRSHSKYDGEKFSWLTRDKEEVQKYTEDPLCGFVPTTSFFYDLFSGFDVIYHPEKNSHIPKELPIQLIGGTEDPVGRKGKSIFHLMDDYNDLGLEKVTCYIYEEGRHEMLNEINKQEVFTDIEKWINNSVI